MSQPTLSCVFILFCFIRICLSATLCSSLSQTLKQTSERQQREYTSVGLGIASAADSATPSPSRAAVYDTSGFGGHNVVIEPSTAMVPSGGAASAGGQLMFAERSSVTENFLRSRAEAVRNIERTILELQDIFTQLTSTIAEQGEMVRRYVLRFLTMLYAFVTYVCDSELIPMSSKRW